MNDWKQKAKQLIREMGISQEDFAERIDQSQGWLNHKLSGRRTASLEDIRLIASGLGLSITDLLDEKAPETASNDQALSTRSKQIPVIAWADITKYLQGTKVPTTRTLTRCWTDPGDFAVIAEDDSMACERLPSIPKGSTVIIEKSRKAIEDAIKRPNLEKENIIALLNTEDGVILRKLTKEGGRYYLVRLDGKFPPTSVTLDTDQILGIALGVHFSFS